ncbi:hypothetical protein PF007_g3353 [Phytophthora fragariae]|uniref:Uncharacterized protein n=1 Tax=Phytophthora fragariae TaxID=53985 RepID=A0A6A3TCM3_9STRA|nr:hypothetical protein PF007_g3353 [Phytophthora fragariae]
MGKATLQARMQGGDRQAGVARVQERRTTGWDGARAGEGDDRLGWHAGRRGGRQAGMARGHASGENDTRPTGGILK